MTDLAQVGQSTQQMPPFTMGVVGPVWVRTRQRCGSHPFAYHKRVDCHHVPKDAYMKQVPLLNAVNRRLKPCACCVEARTACGHGGIS